MQHIFLNRHLFDRRLFTLVGCLLLSGCFGTAENRPATSQTSTTVAGGRPLVVRPSERDDQVVAYVWQQQGQFIRIETAESGAISHQHPFSLTSKQIAHALGQVRFTKAATAPILTNDAIERIAAPLAEALGSATPEQEVTFAVTYRPPGIGLLMPRRVTTGRLFRENDGLHLIIGLLQTPYEEEMLATGMRIAFNPGSRHHRIQKGWSLNSDKLISHPVTERDDWILISPTAWSGSANSETTPQQHGPESQSTGYKQLEERLEALKRLRDKGLISEQTYEQKSRQILEEL